MQNQGLHLTVRGLRIGHQTGVANAAAAIYRCIGIDQFAPGPALRHTQPVPGAGQGREVP